MALLFAFATDTHLIVSNRRNERSRNSPLFFKAMVEQLREADLDFVIHGGDIACGGHGFDASRAEFAASMGEAARMTEAVPFHFLAGNHDTDPQDGSKEIFYRYFAPGGRTYRSFVKEGLRFLLLDSQELPDDQVFGLIGGQQMEWLDGELKTARSKGQPALLFTHHPLMEGPGGLGAGAGLKNSREVLDLLDRHNHIKGVFAGHWHVNRIWQRNGVYHIASAAVDTYPCSWRLVQAGPDGLRVQTRRLALSAPMESIAAEALSPTLRSLQEGTQTDREFLVPLR
jgi:3',5'-cyclic AMP phosphodiesterase CpdA